MKKTRRFLTLNLMLLTTLGGLHATFGYSCGDPNNGDEGEPCGDCESCSSEDAPGPDGGGEQDESGGGAGGAGAPTGPNPSPPTSSAARAPKTTQSLVLPNTSDGRNSAVDLKVFNAVGNLPLEMKRYYKTRTRSGLGDPFGQGQTWSHSYSWGLYSSGSGKRSVAIPGGRVVEFTQSGNTIFEGVSSILHLPESGRGERLYQNGPGNRTFTLLLPDGSRQVFEQVLLPEGGSIYHPRYGRDAGGRQQTYTTDAKARITEVADSAGNRLTLSYGGIQINRKSAVLFNELTATPSADWNEFTVNNPQAFRWLQVQSSQTSFFNLAEIEFYGPGPGGAEVKLSGTIFGTGPSHRSAQSATLVKAFDGNLVSGYCHNNPSGGIAGLDLGAGNENVVTRIRFKPRSSGSMSQPMTSLVGTRFQALVSAPEIIEVLQRVESSDGRAVNYLYDTFNDPSIDQDYLVLSAVDYGDDGVITAGVDSTFSYVVSDAGRAPNVGVFYEPRTTSGIPRMEFKYHDTRYATRGQVSEVRDASTGELVFGFEPTAKRDINFAGGRTISAEYNSNGTASKITDASGQAWQSTWDSGDNFLSSKTDPAGRVTTMDFNHRGLRLSITRPDGLTESSAYDADGVLLASHTLGAPGQSARTTQWLRDANKRVTRINYPDSSYVTYQYNALGLVTQKRERNGSLTLMAYNGPAGLVTRMTLASGTPDQEVWDYEYYAANDPTGSPARLLKSVTDPRDRTTSYQYDSEGRVIRTTYPDGSFRIVGHDPAGNTLYETDAELSLGAPLPSRTTFRTYNGFNKVTTMTDPLGHLTRYYYGDGGVACNCYNGGGPTLITSPEGRLTLREYDEQWRLKKETIGYASAEAATTEYYRDMVGNLAMKIEPGGVTWTYGYDQRNRRTSETVSGPNGRGGSLNYVTTRAHDPFGNVTRETRYGNRVTDTTFDLMNRPLTVKDPAGTITKYTYDAAGNTASVTEDFGGPLARTTSMFHDFRNRLTTTQYPDNTTTQRSYHPGGAPATTTDELGRITRSDTALTTWQDSKGQTWTSFVTSSTDALLHTSTSHPAPMGRFAGTTMTVSPLGRITENHSNPDGTTAETITGLTSSGSTITQDATVTTYTYDDDHLLLTRTTDPEGLNLTTTFTYDSRGNRLTVKDPLNRTTRTEYDLRGNPVKTILPDLREHTATYDALDRRSITTDPKQQVTTTTYRLDTTVVAGLKDPRGNTTNWTHNKLVQILTKTYPNGDTHNHTYDSLHRMQTHKTPKNETCTYFYDLRDRQLKSDWNTTTPDTNRTWWPNGLPKSIDNGVSKSDFTYTVRNELLTETQTLAGRPARSVGYSYDADGLRTGLGYPGTRLVELAWTARAQLAGVSADGPPPLATYTYDKAGRNTGLVHENTITESRSYDTASQLLANTHLKNGSPVSGHGYTIDSTGRRTAETFADGSTPARSYGYDTADQLTSASYGNSQTDSYAYDPIGNRTTASFSRSVGVSPTNGTVTYTANNANQYTTITGWPAPSYDTNGNLLQQNGVTYAWDSENRLLSVTPNTPAIGDKSLVHTYDGQARRVTRTTRQWTATGWQNLETTRFIYDGWNVIEEYDISGTTPTLLRNLTWGADLSGSLQGAGGVGGLLMTEEITGTTTTAYHFHYDGNGNVTEITDLSGNPAATYRYDAFGNTLVATGSYATSNRYRFSTKPLDNEVTNAPLYYYTYRYYDPVTGRWPSRDPIEEEGGLNLYGFVGNDGVDWWDVLGQRVRTADEMTDDEVCFDGQGYDTLNWTVFWHAKIEYEYCCSNSWTYTYKTVKDRATMNETNRGEPLIPLIFSMTSEQRAAIGDMSDRVYKRVREKATKKYEEIATELTSKGCQVKLIEISMDGKVRRGGLRPDGDFQPTGCNDASPPITNKSNRGV